jgi:ankyrin repeat protein
MEQLRGIIRCDNITQSDIDEVEKLFNNGISPDYRDSAGHPLLMGCGSGPDNLIIKYLLERGADPNATTTRGWNAIQCSARGGELEKVKLLHKHGAHIPPQPLRTDYSSEHGPGEESALHHAVYFGHYKVVRYCLENGASRDVNVDGEVGPPAHWAAKHGQSDILKLLVDHGANLEQRDNIKQRGGGNGGWTVMEWFLGWGYFYAVQGKSVGWGWGNDHEAVALYLLEKLSKDQVLTGKGPRRDSLLHWAAEKGLVNVVDIALKVGIDPSALNADNQTARDVARDHNHPECEEYLGRH